MRTAHAYTSRVETPVEALLLPRARRLVEEADRADAPLRERLRAQAAVVRRSAPCHGVAHSVMDGPPHGARRRLPLRGPAAASCWRRRRLACVCQACHRCRRRRRSRASAGASSGPDWHSSSAPPNTIPPGIPRDPGRGFARQSESRLQAKPQSMAFVVNGRRYGGPQRLEQRAERSQAWPQF